MGIWKVKILIILIIFSFNQVSFAQTNNLEIYITEITWNSYKVDTSGSYSLFDFIGHVIINNPNQQNVNMTFADGCGLKLQVAYSGTYNVSNLYPFYCTQAITNVLVKPGNNTFSPYGGIKVKGYTNVTLPDGSYHIQAVENSAISAYFGITLNVNDGNYTTILDQSCKYVDGFVDFPTANFLLFLFLIPIIKVKKKNSIK